MAVRTASIVPDPQARQSLQVVKWEGLTNGDTGSGVRVANWQDRSIQALGTFDTSTLTIQGSNDGGTTWATLRDPSGTALTFDAAGLKQVLEICDLIRPSCAGGASTDIDVYMMCRSDRVS